MDKEETIEVPIEVLKNIAEYCEHNAIYDKLSSYGNFYYKIIRLLDEHRQIK